MLNYALYPNGLTKDDPDDQIAGPIDIITNDLDALVMKVTRQNSMLKPWEVKGAIEAYWQAIADYIRHGEAYSDNYVSTHFRISGVFQNDDDHFDPKRHTLEVAAKLKPAVSSAVDEVNMKKAGIYKSKPVIDSVYDWGSDSRDSVLTPGDVLEISGELLKIQGNLDEEGIFFTNQGDGRETEGERPRTNEPKTLTLKIPALPTGIYCLEVRNSHHDRKTLRVGIFAPTLVVS